MREWFYENQTAITWFIIGWLAQSIMISLINGEYLSAALAAFIAWLNYEALGIKR